MTVKCQLTGLKFGKETGFKSEMGDDSITRGGNIFDDVNNDDADANADVGLAVNRSSKSRSLIPSKMEFSSIESN